MIRLVEDTIDNRDVDQLVSWLKTYPRLTKGPQTKKLEKKWSTWLGVKYSVFCNSGSSANLLMLAALIEAQYLRNTKIVIPALAWATDLAPIIQLGLQPILCDIDMNTLSIDINELEMIFQSDAPSTLLLVSILGLVPNMKDVVELCKNYDVLLVEDVCESMGSRYEDQHLGTFGLMSSFSTFFGHHISTIEGGFVSTNDKHLYEMLLMLRSHGWDRDLDESTQKLMRDEWGVDNFNALYTFYVPAFNVRSTDLQAFIGLNQIDKLDHIVKVRQQNFVSYQDLIHNDFWKPVVTDNSLTSNFAYPIIHPKKNEIVESLQHHDVEVRPLVCGSMGTQPMFIKRYGKLILPQANKVDQFGLYIPNHPQLKRCDIVKISDIINEVIN
jgi:CDP-4-dehydro-6-deoxyglucose reductase, E1